ncbi:CSEP0218 putative effector protein [Blumeria hordei DH14]|uniref:CSEP0218 putative effector protein n=1 Tax=Blumeria graminis f. sp. hordei (strain DH14) TaxID=546991 RepID=N1JI45_BLUG1|nr:CSEP0218 putative effector protein [Blumeria hordei DH14]
MKTLSTCVAACLCLLPTTIAAYSQKGDFFCGHKKVPFADVQSSAKRACKSLRNVENSHTLPAAYSGTLTLNIDDAILFSWPIEKNSGTHSEVFDKFRVVINAKCKLIGVVMKNKVSGDKRCIQSVNSPLTLSLSTATNKNEKPNIYGYHCRDRLITQKIAQVTKAQANKIKKLGISYHDSISAAEKLILNKMFKTQVTLFPIDMSNSPSKRMSNSPYQVVLNQLFDIRGMVHKVKDKWIACEEVWYVKEDKPILSSLGVNSMGELRPKNLRAHTCGALEFSATSINSHLHAACHALQDQTTAEPNDHDKYPLMTQSHSLQESGPTLMWPLRLPEEATYNIHERQSNTCMIFINKACRLVGVFRHTPNGDIPCLQSKILSRSRIR